MNSFHTPNRAAIRRMGERLNRSGIRMDADTLDRLAAALAAPADRSAMTAAVRAEVAHLKALGTACTPDALLEAAAALRGEKSWNVLAAKLPSNEMLSSKTRLHILPGLPGGGALPSQGTPEIDEFRATMTMAAVGHLAKGIAFGEDAEVTTRTFRDLVDTTTLARYVVAHLGVIPSFDPDDLALRGVSLADRETLSDLVQKEASNALARAHAIMRDNLMGVRAVVDRIARGEPMDADEVRGLLDGQHPDLGSGGVSPGGVEVTVWLVHHVHRKDMTLATGPYDTREDGENQLHCIFGMSDDQLFRLVKWTGPDEFVKKARQQFHPGMLIDVAQLAGGGKIEAISERSGREEPGYNAYIGVLQAAMMRVSLLPGHALRHPVVGPLIRRLAECSSVDEASTAITEAANQQEALAVSLPDGDRQPWVDAFALMGAIRTANTEVCTLDTEEHLPGAGYRMR